MVSGHRCCQQEQLNDSCCSSEKPSLLPGQNPPLRNMKFKDIISYFPAQRELIIHDLLGCGGPTTSLSPWAGLFHPSVFGEWLLRLVVTPVHVWDCYNAKSQQLFYHSSPEVFNTTTSHPSLLRVPSFGTSLTQGALKQREFLQQVCSGSAAFFLFPPPPLLQSQINAHKFT